MEKRPVIETRSLGIGYTGRGSRHTVHSGLDLQLYPGELTCLLGRNGAGKSTLLKTLCVTYGQTEITSEKEPEG